MLVEFRRLGMEGQEVFSGVILVVVHLSAHRPEVAVDVEEIHIDGNLDAVPLEEFLFIYFVHDDHLSVGYGGDQAVVVRLRRGAVGHAEEPGDEEDKGNEEQADGQAYPGIMDEMRRQENKHGTGSPTAQDGSVRVSVNFYPLHISNKTIIYPFARGLYTNSNNIK